MSDPQQQFPPAPGAQPPATASTPPQPPYGSTPAYQPAYPGATAQNGHPAGAQSGNPTEAQNWPSDPGTAQAVYPAAPATRGPGGLARVAFILAIVSVALSPVMSIVRVVLYTQMNRFHLSMHVVDWFNLGSNIVLFLCCAAALVLGIVAARGERKLLAGVAIGVGVVGVANLAVGFLLSALTPLLYG